MTRDNTTGIRLCILTALAVFVQSSNSAFVSSAMESDMTLIPRSVIFGNPERVGANISPDGKNMSFLAPREGVLNVFVVERGKDISEAKPVTNEKVRPLRQYYWSAGGDEILYVSWARRCV